MNIIKKITIILLIATYPIYGHSAAPMWTVTPLTETRVIIAANGTANVEYRVKNQSKNRRTLTMKGIPGVTQIKTPGYCSSPFTLNSQQSCILKLTIDASTLIENISDGPVICSDGFSIQCYRPRQTEILQIIKSQIMNYTIGGTVYGLLGTLVLDNNTDDILSMAADGTFTFPTALAPNDSYLVTVQSQPADQTCSVSNGSGTITNANITNVTVNCSTNTRTVGGTVSGLSGTVVLQNNAGDDLAINSNGSYTFPASIVQGASYNVTILTQPATQTCTVSNGSGTAGASNITNIQVNCSTNAYTVGGTVSGLIGSVVLQDNGGDNLTINSNGSYTFATSVAQGATYNVTVLTQPGAHTCTVSNGSGTMGGANVTNVNLNCVSNSATLTRSASQLALSVTGFTEYGVTGTPSSGLARTITITNTGGTDALNIAVGFPTWPTGTTSSTTCSSTLTAGNACTITITPGNTATSDGTNPCSKTAPIPQAVEVTSDNATTVSFNVVILSYACIYQGGYVYAFDDTTPNTGSVGGKVATTSDQSSNTIWSSNGGGGTSLIYGSRDTIPGISETSTSSSGHPSYADFSAFFAATYTNPNPFTAGSFSQCNGKLDGNCNTNNILMFYNQFITNNTGDNGGTPPYAASPGPTPTTYYAAGLCKQTISGYSDWYLPALCELGYGAGGCGVLASPATQNMEGNLNKFNALNTIPLGSYVWSSTEYAASNQTQAWFHVFNALGGSGPDTKNRNLLKTRCSRALTV